MPKEDPHVLQRPVSILPNPYYVCDAIVPPSQNHNILVPIIIIIYCTLILKLETMDLALHLANMN